MRSLPPVRNQSRIRCRYLLWRQDFILSEKCKLKTRTHIGKLAAHFCEGTQRPGFQKADQTAGKRCRNGCVNCKSRASRLCKNSLFDRTMRSRVCSTRGPKKGQKRGRSSFKAQGGAAGTLQGFGHSNRTEIPRRSPQQSCRATGIWRHHRIRKPPAAVHATKHQRQAVGRRTGTSSR